jgi:hypothetical protein
MGLAGNSVVGVVEQTTRPAATACGEEITYGRVDELWFDCDTTPIDFGAPERFVSAQELSEAKLAPEPDSAEAAAASADAAATAIVAAIAPRAEAGLPIYTKATLSPTVHFADRKACRVVLKAWFMEHLAHPYVTEQSDFDHLQSKTSLCRLQIINWFCNERLRNKEYRAFKAGQAVGPSSVPEPKLLQRASERTSCSLCGAQFADVGEQRAHFQSDWHRLNLKRAQRAALPESEAEALLGGATELKRKAGLVPEPKLLQRAATELKLKRALKRRASSLGDDAPTADRAVLKGWFMEHLAHPYVTKQSDFDHLQSETSLCRSQIITWFCNERLRNKEYRAFKAGQPVVPSSVPEPKLLQRAATELKLKRALKRRASSLGDDAPTADSIKRVASAP